MMKTTKRLRVGMAIVALALPGTALAQSAVAQACGEGQVLPDLGISGLDCVGECTVTLDERGRERYWRFSVEPRILEIREGSPADGRLRAGDRLVAVDENLITTREAGERYATLAPGEAVRIRFRRGGRVGMVTLEVGSRCDARIRSDWVGRVPPPPLATSPVIPPEPDMVTAPRVVLEGVLAPAAEPALPPVPGQGPVGRLGAGFSCSKCGVRTDPETGESQWFFSAPLEITNVEPGGPADRAGIQVGDLIAAIDGAAVDSKEGGEAFSALTPGRAVNVTVVRRDGRSSQVRVVPSRSTRVQVRTAPVAPDVVPSVSVAPAGPARAAVGAMPLRYVGSVAGVEVEVRGEPVRVSELEGERTLIIDAGGTWIRIKVPAGGVPKP